MSLKCRAQLKCLALGCQCRRSRHECVSRSRRMVSDVGLNPAACSGGAKATGRGPHLGRSGGRASSGKKCSHVYQRRCTHIELKVAVRREWFRAVRILSGIFAKRSLRPLRHTRAASSALSKMPRYRFSPSTVICAKSIFVAPFRLLNGTATIHVRGILLLCGIPQIDRRLSRLLRLT